MKTKTKRDEVLNILCLEDSPKDVEIMRESLIDAGYDLNMDITKVEKEYVSLLRNRKYDLILSDFKLPGFDGFKALKWAVEICPEVPFICVSGTVGEEIAVDLLIHGAVDYILKDRLEKLPFVVKRALDDAKKKKALMQAEEELIISAEKWKTTFDSITDIICITSAEHEFIEINKAGCRSLGMERKDIIGKKCFELMHHSRVPIMGCPCSSALNTKTIEMIEVVENGRYFHLSAWPILNEKSEIVAFSHSVKDITERKRAEIAILESEARYKAIMQSASDAIVSADSNGIIIAWNNAAKQIFGYSYPEALGQPVTLIIPLFYKDGHNSGMQWLQSGENSNIIGKTTYVDGKRKSGIVFPLELSLATWETKSGQYFTGIIRDITERKRAEEELHESEEKLRNYFESAPDGIFIVDHTGQYFEINRSACQITGYSREEFEKMLIGDVLAEESFEDGLAHFKKLVETGAATSDLWHKHKDGSKRCLTVDAVKLSETRFLGFCKDITNRKLAEEALAQEQYLTDNFMQNIPDRIYFKDRASRFIRISKALAQQFGLSDPVQAIGKSDFDFFSKEHAKKAYDDEQGIIRTGQPLSKEEKETWADRPETWVYSTKLPLRDKEGNIIGTFGISMDITVRKEIEILLIQKNQEIEAQNEEYRHINEELYKAKERAEESDFLKTAFLQNMSHEIRTPMNGILGFSELLKNPGLKSEKQQEFIGLIEQSGKRMLNIINDIVNISKIETGQVELDMQVTNVNKLLQHLHIFFKPEAEGKGLSLTYKTGLSDELCIIETDNTKLTQIISNLVNNALKFTKSGSVEFGYKIVETLHATSVTTSVDTFQATYLQFYVQDTGIGIDPDQQSIIFERFRQVDMSITRQFEGAGLGLAISKAFVEKLGGKIWVESELGKGAAFFFNIPFNSKAISKTEKPSKAGMEEELLHINILIAEDDEICMIYLKELLENEKANLFYAHNGQEAFDIVKTTPELQIVLMDLKMPVMNGFEATRMIKKINPELPVIAQSAYAFSDDQQKAKIAGCNDFIGKPLKRELLLSMINKYLANR